MTATSTVYQNLVTNARFNIVTHAFQTSQTSCFFTVFTWTVKKQLGEFLVVLLAQSAQLAFKLLVLFGFYQVTQFFRHLIIFTRIIFTKLNNF
jgi:hypothetical protein